jgi:hypothetical protein
MSFSRKDVEEAKRLCLNFKKHFGFYCDRNTNWIDERNIDFSKILVPNCYDKNIDDDLKKRAYIWFKNLAIVYATCVCHELWDQVSKIPELKKLMKLKDHGDRD